MNGANTFSLGDVIELHKHRRWLSYEDHYKSGIIVEQSTNEEDGAFSLYGIYWSTGEFGYCTADDIKRVTPRNPPR